MKLYRTPTGHWAGTKDDAAAIAKTHNTTYEQCEVPYDKAGLLAFLNDFRVGAKNEPVEPISYERVPEPEPRQPTLHEKQMHRLAVEEFIFAAPLEVAIAVGEIAMNRMRDFARGK
jgi:hypothetical protein